MSNYYLKSDGSTGYTQIPNMGSAFPNGTFLTRVKPVSAGTNSAFICADDVDGWAVGFNVSGSKLFFSKVGVNNVESTSAISTGVETAVGVSYNSGTNYFSNSYSGRFDGTSTCGVAIPNMDSNNWSFLTVIQRENLSESYAEFLASDANGGITIVCGAAWGNYLTLAVQGVAVVTSGVLLNDLNPHTIGITFDGTNSLFYLDGVLVSTLGSPGTFGTIGNYYLGNSNYAGNPGPFTGKLQNTLFYDGRIIDGTEMAAYHAGTMPSTTNLKARWDFNDGSGTTVTDSSGNGNDGTVVSGFTWESSILKDQGVKFYINGILDATVAYSSSITSGGVYSLGGHYPSLTSMYDGGQRDMYIFSRVLSDTEIADWATGTPPSSTSLVAHYPTTTGGTRTITVADDFVAADATDLNGRSLPTGGGTWSVLAGAFAIYSNTATTTTAQSIVKTDSGLTDNTVYTLVSSDNGGIGGDFGIYFKMDAAHLNGYLFYGYASGGIYLYQVISGGYYLLTTLSVTFDPTVQRKFIASFSGSEAACYLEGVGIITYNGLSGSGTYVGFYAPCNGGQTYFNDFKCLDYSFLSDDSGNYYGGVLINGVTWDLIPSGTIRRSLTLLGVG